MTPDAWAVDLVIRMSSDLQTRFQDVLAIVREDAESGWVCEIREGTSSWGHVGLPVHLDDDDDIATADTEALIAEVYENVFDNLWPDELVDAWPPCPGHAGEPLQPRLVRGRASWVCSRDDSIVIEVGSL